MSWYRYSDGYAPLYRMPITLEATAGGSVNATISLTSAADIDLLWTGSQSDGYDIRVTMADGRTLIAPSTAWDITGWNRTNRTGTIRIQGLTVSAGMDLLWLYWGHPTGAATSVWGTVTSVTGAKTTYLHRVDPAKLDPARVFRGASRQQARATRPRTMLRKASNEVLRVYFLIDSLRRNRIAESMQSDDYDAPLYGAHDVVDGNGSDVPTMYTQTDGRWAVDSDGRLYYSILIKAGTDATRYTARCTLVTDQGETIRYHGGIAVSDVVAT